jgi:Ca2+-binding RTX toxin-like protein
MRAITAPLFALALAIPMLPGSASAAPVTCDGRRATIVGTSGNDNIEGTPHADVIAGLGGNDTIAGRGGNDVICGGYGADRLGGGHGNDRLFGGKDRLHVTDEGSTERDGDTLRGGPGNDTLVPGLDTRPADDVIPDALSWDTAPRGVRIDIGRGVATGDGTDTFDASHASVTGSTFGDVIDGGPGADHIFGLQGNDVLRGHGGNDYIVTDAAPSGDDGGVTDNGKDDARGGYGNDTIDATGGSDTLRGGPGNDFVDDMGNSVDEVRGGSGDDTVQGELVRGGDVLLGGPGKDVVSIFTNLVNPGALASTGTWDLATGAVSIDIPGEQPLTAGALGETADLATYGTTWTITGTNGPDEVSASGTRGTVFHALEGNDTFRGSADDDTFDGGPGTDHALTMGVGDDTCISVEVLDDTSCEHVLP